MGGGGFGQRCFLGSQRCFLEGLRDGMEDGMGLEDGRDSVVFGRGGGLGEMLT